jgi:hypothetical protein
LSKNGKPRKVPEQYATLRLRARFLFFCCDEPFFLDKEIKNKDLGRGIPGGVPWDKELE